MNNCTSKIDLNINELPYREKMLRPIRLIETLRLQKLFKSVLLLYKHIIMDLKIDVYGKPLTANAKLQIVFRCQQLAV